MEPLAQLDHIIGLFGRLGINVRRERLGGGGGGLCRVHGQPVVFLDLDADVATRVDRCLAALAALPEAGSMYLTPVLREQLENLQGSNGQS